MDRITLSTARKYLKRESVDNWISVGFDGEYSVDLWIYTIRRGLRVSHQDPPWDNEYTHSEYFEDYDEAILEGRIQLGRGTIAISEKASLANIKSCVNRLLSRFPGTEFYVVDMRQVRDKVYTLFDFWSQEFGESVCESVVDYTREELDPKVFDEDNQLLPEVRQFIQAFLSNFSVYGKISKAYITGSILSYQWSRNSDIDVHFVLDGDIRAAAERATEVCEEIILPSTDHPVNFYVLDDFEQDWATADGVYDLDEDEWVKGPYNLSANVTEFSKMFKGFVDSADLTAAELRRDIVDYERLKEMSPNELKNLDSLVREKLREIEEGAQELARDYEVAHALRKVGYKLSVEEIQEYAAQNLLPTNVLYKLLERYHYIELFRNIRKALILGKGKISSDKDVERIGDIVGEAIPFTYWSIGHEEPSTMWAWDRVEKKLYTRGALEKDDIHMNWLQGVGFHNTLMGRVTDKQGSIYFEGFHISKDTIEEVVNAILNKWPNLNWFVFEYASGGGTPLGKWLKSNVQEMTSSGATGPVEGPLRRNSYKFRKRRRRRRSNEVS